MQRLIQIVPEIVPGVSGLGDYALAVGGALRSNFGTESSYLVISRYPAPEGRQQSSEGHIARLFGKDQRKIETALLGLTDSDRPPVLLQYCGYGYHQRGVPLPLVNALTLLQRRKRIRLAVMFHELYAFGSPLSSSFWLSPLQRRLAKRLAQTADSVITNCQLQATKLQGWTRRHPHILPVPSNVGETSAQVPLKLRQATAVVFGQFGNRQRTHSFLSKVKRTLDALEISKIIDIGPGKPDPDPSGRPVEFLGSQSPKIVSEQLAQCRIGILAYPPHCLTRSGVFAAFAAHGLLTIVHPTEETAFVGPKPRIHCLTTLDEAPNIQNCEAIAQNLFSWYSQHTISAHAQLCTQLLFPPI